MTTGENTPAPWRQRVRWIAGVTASLAGAGAAIVVSGCGGSALAGQAGPHPAAASKPANPVPILRQTGARPDPGVHVGTPDATGNIMATGHFGGPNGDEVTVITAAQGDLKVAMASRMDAKPDDDHAVIQGKGFYVTDYSSSAGWFGSTPRSYFRVSPLVIAQRVGGTLVTGSPTGPVGKPHYHAPVSPAPAAAAPAAPASAPAAPPATQFTNSVAVVDQFYQDITDHNYAAAWALGGDNIGGTDYNAWVAGYSTTESITLSNTSEWGSGQVGADLSAFQSDGSIKAYSGTYTVSNGVIINANITQTS